MTFEDWCRSVNVYEQDNLKACWDAAIASEREACAKICEGYPTSSYAYAIRARSDNER